MLSVGKPKTNLRFNEKELRKILCLLELNFVTKSRLRECLNDVFTLNEGGRVWHPRYP